MLIHSPRNLALMVISQRKKLKLSQAEAGKRAGLKQQTISNFENNPESTQVSTLFRILAAVELDLKLFDKGKTATGQWQEEW